MRYGDVRALHDVSLRVAEGETVGLLGRNGAGKSTLLRLVTGVQAPDRGRALVYGVPSTSAEARTHIGFLPEDAPLWHELRVIEALRHVAALRGIARGEREHAVERALERTDTRSVAHQRVRTLSRGFRQRVALAQAIVHAPRVLVLDEPTTGLDPHQVRAFRALLQGLGEEVSILLSTHVVSEMAASCDRVVVLERGELLGERTPDDDLERWFLDRTAKA